MLRDDGWLHNSKGHGVPKRSHPSDHERLRLHEQHQMPETLGGLIRNVMSDEGANEMYERDERTSR